MRWRVEGVAAGIFLITFLSALALYVLTSSAFELGGFIKPATIMQYSGFLAFAFGLQLLRSRLLSLRRKTLDMLIILAFFFLMGAAFEALWSFHYWFATYELDVLSGYPANSETLDTAEYFPNPELVDIYFYQDVPLNFSAKKNMMLTMIAVYLVYFLFTIRRDSTSGNS